jgi:hypothetical protein
MKPSPARELARRYAAGELSLEEYRAQRRYLIDAVCAGTAMLQSSKTAPYPRHSHKRYWFALAPLAVAVVVAAAVGLWAARGQQLSALSASVHKVKPSGSQLLHEFLVANDWSDASIARFMASWRQLSERERHAARNGYTYPRVSAELQQQIVSQQAMLELAPDPKAATEHLAHLQQMATLLGSG